jgi:hypothetical protein
MVWAVATGSVVAAKTLLTAARSVKIRVRFMEMMGYWRKIPATVLSKVMPSESAKVLR